MPNTAAPRTRKRAETFGARLKRLRLRQHWSQHDLAEYTQGFCTERTIGNYERGVTYPRPGSPQLRILAEIFRVEPRYLLRGEEEE